jgi:hypothetical protein
MNPSIINPLRKKAIAEAEAARKKKKETLPLYPKDPFHSFTPSQR